MGEGPRNLNPRSIIPLRKEVPAIVNTNMGHAPHIPQVGDDGLGKFEPPKLIDLREVVLPRLLGHGH